MNLKNTEGTALLDGKLDLHNLNYCNFLEQYSPAPIKLLGYEVGQINVNTCITSK